MRSLFFINSPFQLLCAVEAVLAFNCKNNVLVIFNKGKGKTKEQIYFLLKSYGSFFEEIIFIDRELGTIGGWFDGLEEINKLIEKYPEVAKIFIGDYRSGLVRHFANSVKTEEVIVLDDGFSTINLLPKIKTNSLHSYRDYIKYLLSKGTYRFNSDSKVSFFSIFEDYLDSKNIYVNNFNNLISDEKWTESDSVYWLGSAIVEDEIVERSYYIEEIRQCLGKVKTEREIIYFPHRREEEQKLKVLKDKFGFRCKYSELPIELYVVQSKVKPNAIISFYSTALYSLNRILDSSNIYYIPIDEDKILKQQSEIKKIYQILRNEVKDINTIKL